MFFKTTPIALAVLAATAVSIPVCAASPDPDVISVRVSLADLNLAGKPGAAVALRRIRKAAETICGDKPMVIELARVELYDDCARAAVGRAVASLDNPTVTALYTGRTARSPEMASR